MLKILTPLIRLSLFLALWVVFGHNAYATHNRAGEIVYTQDPNIKYKITATITTYTKASADAADRDSLEICWGDGTCEFVLRNNGAGDPPQGQELANDIKKNFYTAIHLYPGPGHYKMGMLDRNRNAGILNVNPPSSDIIEFFISTSVTFRSNQFFGPNNSPILLQPPIDIGCVGQRFIHNPNAYDVDGDSLVYELIRPQRDFDVDVPLYYFPNDISPGADNIFSVDAVTGDIVWESPQKEGEYNIAIYIIEYRNGAPQDTMIRDMQILIMDCENMPPEIETIEEICVIAGDVLEFDVIATDSDIPIQNIDLTALGGPFEETISPATFDAPSGYQIQPISARFRWQTTCEHIESQFYTVVFKAVDDSFMPNSSGIATLKTVRIKVVGPPPIDVIAEAQDDVVDISWESPYICENAADNYFRTFTVWRREGSNQFTIDKCDPGLTGKGYEKITNSTKVLEGGRYIFRDEAVERGRTYCYRVLAEFAKISAGGFPFNPVESLPSNEACLQLNRDIPLITHVDVDETSTTDGEIIVRWSKPIVPDLDTMANPGPYTYEVWRATGFDNTTLIPVPGSSVTSPTFAAANDTVFIDTGINTEDTPYTYAIAFTTGASTEPLGTTNTASSTFLSIVPSDQTNLLTWEHRVTWDNYEYNVYRKSSSATVFSLIGNTAEQNYLDDDALKNGEEYCYYIECIGTYGVEGIVSPLINRSQEECGIPIDNIAPCPPNLVVNNICDQGSEITDEDAFENELTWTNPNDICPETDDVISYEVFYTPTEGGDFSLITEVDGAENINYIDMPEQGIAGCYYVVAIDSVGNRSLESNIVCVDNCPLYMLPNAFTPNGDNANDFFIPYPYRFIDRIDIKIYNQWGNLVHQNTNPDINWDGANINGEVLSDGVYYYICRVFEKRVAGIIENPEILKGFIELRKGK